MKSQKIESKEEYDLALKKVEDLIAKNPEQEFDKESLELIDSIQEYESTHYPIAKPTKEQMEKFRKGESKIYESSTN